MPPEAVANTPIRDIFFQESFTWALNDFYHDCFPNTDIPREDVVMESIFWDTNLFAGFLLHCREENFSCVPESMGREQRAIFLYTLDCLRWDNARRTQEILSWDQWLAPVSMKEEECLDGWRYCAEEAIKKTVDTGIYSNDRGEVLYTLEETSLWYRVYSYQTGIHEIDREWNVLRCDFENKNDRKKVLSRIQKYRRFQEFFYMDEITDPDDIKLWKYILRAFAAKEGIDWPTVREDHKELRVYTEKLRSYVLGRLLDLEKDFKKLQDNDLSPWLKLVN